jgi:hypothetical protein
LVRKGGRDEGGEIFGEEQDTGRERVASIDRRRVPDFAERLWVRVRDGRACTIPDLVEEKQIAN